MSKGTPPAAPRQVIVDGVAHVRTDPPASEPQCSTCGEPWMCAVVTAALLPEEGS